MPTIKNNVPAKPVKHTKVSMPVVVAIDLGFGNVKLFSSAKGKIVAPAAVVEANPDAARVRGKETFAQSSEIDLDRLLITIEEGSYYIGNKALEVQGKSSARTQERNRAKDEKSIALLKTFIAQSVPDEEGTYEVELQTGLPDVDYKKKYLEDLTEYLNGLEYTITFHLVNGSTIEKTIKVKSARICRQAEGTIVNHQIDFHPETLVEVNENFRERVGVINIGHFTTEYGIFVDSVIHPDETYNGSTVATTAVYRSLKAKLPTYFTNLGLPDYTAKDMDLDRAVMEGIIYHNGEDRDVSPVVQECAQEVSKNMVQNIMEAWSEEATSVHAILLAGGGAYLFSEYLKEEFEKKGIQLFTTVEDPQFSNVLGYYKLAVMELSETIGYELAYKNYVEPVFGDVA